MFGYILEKSIFHRWIFLVARLVDYSNFPFVYEVKLYNSHLVGQNANISSSALLNDNLRKKTSLNIIVVLWHGSMIVRRSMGFCRPITPLRWAS